MPTYSMSAFRLPAGLCSKIESIFAHYWWSKGSEKGIHWKYWKALSKHKTKGGLGFRELVYFNQALLAKQRWRLLEFPNSLIAQMLKAHLQWRIGDDRLVNIYIDSWVPHHLTFTVQSSPCLPVDSRNFKLRWPLCLCPGLPLPTLNRYESICGSFKFHRKCNISFGVSLTTLLPTREVLLQWKIVQDTTCFHCMGSIETVIHAIHDCTVSSSVLCLMGWAPLLTTLLRHDAATCSPVLPLDQIVFSAKNYDAEYQKVLSIHHRRSSLAIPDKKWQSPPSDSYSRLCGAVAMRDLACCQSWYAPKIGISFEVDASLTLIIEYDSSTAIHLILHEDPCYAAEGALVEDIRRLLSSLPCYSALVVPHTANRVADRLT
ncbi:unnamed protein product [Prunus armeniaca]